MGDLFEEFGLIKENNKRLYKENLKERDYLLENCTPYKITIKSYVIKDSSWGNVIQSLASYLIDNSNKTCEEILSFKTEWTKAAVFTQESRTNFKKVKENLFVNCNHTALHSCWLIQDLLGYFEIDLNDVELIIRRRGVSEPKEVREYFRNLVIEQFKEYLMIEKFLSVEKVSLIIEKHFKHINAYQSKISSAYYDFFLFDEYVLFDMYRGKFMDKYKKDFSISNPNNIKIVERDLNLLKDFYKSFKY